MSPMPDSITRRQLLGAAAAGALATPLASPLLAAGAGVGRRNAADRRLVLIFLDGGNDGLNTVVPFEDDRYHRARPQIALPVGELHSIGDTLGLHPALGPWRALFDEGRLTVVPCVGYEQPNRSHFVSRDIWHSGLAEPGDHPTGWIGRALESHEGRRLPPVALGAEEAPLILRGRARSGLTLRDLADFQLDLPEEGREQRLAALAAGAGAGAGDPTAGPAQRIAGLARDSYRTAERLRGSVAQIPPGSGYPDNALGERLRLVARLVRADEGPPVFWTSIAGFDTHAVQAGTHAALLGQVGSATAAFLEDLARDGADGRTLLLVYSEFGRRVRENGSRGTDHGAAGPVFALGGGVRGGVLGAPPDLEDLLDGDVRPRVDFRCVFREAACEWMGWEAQPLFDRPADAAGYLAG